MTGTKKTYNINTKNYFDFFGIEEKFSISVRSLTAHYKRVVSFLRDEIARSLYHEEILLRDKLLFADNAFQTLLNPLERAKYITGLHGADVDIRDAADAEMFSLCNELRDELNSSTTEEDVELFQTGLKDHSDFIIQQISTYIDEYKNYNGAASLIATWFELHDLYEESKQRQQQIQDGIVFVAF